MTKITVYRGFLIIDGGENFEDISIKPSDIPSLTALVGPIYGNVTNNCTITQEAKDWLISRNKETEKDLMNYILCDIIFDPLPQEGKEKYNGNNVFFWKTNFKTLYENAILFINVSSIEEFLNEMILDNSLVIDEEVKILIDQYHIDQPSEEGKIAYINKVNEDILKKIEE